MTERDAATQVIDVIEVGQNWSQLLERVALSGTRVVVERSGVPVAAIISPSDLERFTRWEARRQRRFEALEAMREPFRNVPPEEIEREVAKALSEVREEMREERRQQDAPQR